MNCSSKDITNLDYCTMKPQFFGLYKSVQISEELQKLPLFSDYYNVCNILTDSEHNGVNSS